MRISVRSSTNIMLQRKGPAGARCSGTHYPSALTRFKGRRDRSCMALRKNGKRHPDAKPRSIELGSFPANDRPRNTNDLWPEQPEVPPWLLLIPGYTIRQSFREISYTILLNGDTDALTELKPVFCDSGHNKYTMSGSIYLRHRRRASCRFFHSMMSRLSAVRTELVS